MMGVSRVVEILRPAPQEVDALDFCDERQPRYSFYPKAITFYSDYSASCACINKCYSLTLFIIPSANLTAQSCNLF